MSGSGFFASPAYKQIMAKAYGIGAAIVILGALFKILHLPGANIMLIVGLGTESLIFFLSAFEPPHEMPDWSLVYPELVGLEPRDRGVSSLMATGLVAGGAVAGGAIGGGAFSGGSQAYSSSGGELATLLKSGYLDQETVQKLGEGIKKLAQTAEHLANLGEAGKVTEAYVQTMKVASESVGNLLNAQAKLGQTAETLAGSYATTARVVTDSGLKLSGELATAGESIVHTISSNGEQLARTYQSFGESMARQMDKVASEGVKYSQEMGVANQKLSAINSVYELQLSSINQQLDASRELTKSLGEISNQLGQSVSDTTTYKHEVAKLSKTLGELNSIYGNMLSAMSVGSR